MTDDALLWLARLAMLLAAAVWLPRLVAAFRGRGPWWGPWWPPAVLLATTALALAALAAITDESLGDLFAHGLWREGVAELVGW